MRSKNEYDILKLLNDSASELIDFAIAIIKAGYGASQYKISNEFNKLSERKTTSDPEKELLRLKKHYYATISHLVREGLVERINIKNKLFLKITASGRDRLAFLGQKAPLHFSAIEPVYQKTPSTEAVIVSYDIPEKERWKRDWMRRNLLNFGFKLVQKSLWHGNYKLPEEFIDDLKTLELIGKVQIFSLGKSGTLKAILVDK